MNTFLFETEPWVGEAACEGRDPAIFFPGKHGNATAIKAKKICGECPVRVQCLNYALQTNQKHGIWGGVSERGRRAMQRPRRLKVAA